MGRQCGQRLLVLRRRGKRPVSARDRLAVAVALVLMAALGVLMVWP
jgi:hypothetical protein